MYCNVSSVLSPHVNSKQNAMLAQYRDIQIFLWIHEWIWSLSVSLNCLELTSGGWGHCWRFSVQSDYLTPALTVLWCLTRLRTKQAFTLTKLQCDTKVLFLYGTFWWGTLEWQTAVMCPWSPGDLRRLSRALTVKTLTLRMRSEMKAMDRITLPHSLVLRAHTHARAYAHTKGWRMTCRNIDLLFI